MTEIVGKKRTVVRVERVLEMIKQLPRYGPLKHSETGEEMILISLRDIMSVFVMLEEEGIDG